MGGDSGPAIIPGEPEESLLIKAVSYKEKKLKMPPKDKLEANEVAILKEWIRRGAPDPRVSTAKKSPHREINYEEGKEFWSFKKLRGSEIPQPKNNEWSWSAIDKFVLNRLEEKGLAPLENAQPHDLIRRLSFDLTGLPPSKKHIESFNKDSSQKNLATIVDELLVSKQFGERWGRHWLDLARYAESTGRTRNYPYPFAWRYRDYVIQSYNEDKPYDQFVREQVAGDLLPTEKEDEKAENLVATGFLALSPLDLNERNRRKFMMDIIDEQIDVLSQSVLGLTISCARCHDHKFDPIAQKDYYALAGFFMSTEPLLGYGARAGGGNKLQNSLLLSLPLKEGEEAKKDSAPKVEPNPRIARQRRNIQNQLEKAEEKTRELRKEFAISRSRRRPKNARRPEDIQTEIGRVRRTIRNLEQRLERFQPSPATLGPLAMGLRDRRQPIDCRINIRGDANKLGDKVGRDIPTVLKEEDFAIEESKLEESSGRLELAYWLTDTENPLTARVYSNRIWHHLFGRGLVRTVDNFGKTGEQPTHPELLDYLARTLISNGWSTKKTIRQIVLSRTYQLASIAKGNQTETDPGNLFLWRQNQRRLEAEAIRDSLLSISGQILLDPPKQGSPVLNLPRGEIRLGTNQRGGRSLRFNPNHRTVYLPIVRSFVPEFLEVFDFPDPTLVKGQRDVTTVPTQALFLLNNPFVKECSDRTAKIILGATKDDKNKAIDLSFSKIFARKATNAEREALIKYLDQLNQQNDSNLEQSWSRVIHSLFASSEFRYLN